jgi:repressor LexA
MLKEKLKHLRKKQALTQSQLAHRLGVSQQAVAKWESGRALPEPAMLIAISEILCVSIDYLLSGKPGFPKDILPCKPFFSVPLVGEVKAGFGLDAFEDLMGCHPAEVRDPDNYFYLSVRGDSMEPYIRPGDLALVRRQNTLQSGEIGVILLPSGEGVLKRFIAGNGSVLLESFNPSTPPLSLSGPELDGLVILGKVVETKTCW